VALEELVQVAVLHVLDDHEERLALRADAQDPDDVRILQVKSMVRGTMLMNDITNLIVTKNTNYALRAANPRAANRPSGELAARRAYHYDSLTAPLITIYLASP
jgi:hypothetical protein